MRVLVTGGCGFIGSHLVNFLKRKGDYVETVDLRPKSECYMKLEADNYHQADLRDPPTCIRLLKDMDHVYHFAANMGGIHYITEVKADIMRDNTRIDMNILEACRLNGVRRIFFPSSACVYPESLQSTPRVKPLRESDAYPAQPDTPYGWSKLFTELMMKAYHEDYGLDIRIARLHNVYGAYSYYKGGREKAPAALCRKVAKAPDGGVIVIWGDGKQTRSFVYIDDALEAIQKLMQINHVKPLNVGTDRLVAINQLADIIIRISGKQIKKQYDLLRPQGVRGRNADLTLVKKVLGWEPRTSLEEGLKVTYDWVLQQVKTEK